MGLHSDSLNIYESILTIVSPQDAQVQDKIKKRIGLLKKEIADMAETKPKGVSAKDISMLKKSFSSQGDVSEILDSASAFQEMGLHGEAIAEYVKMFKQEYPADKIVPGLVESLLKLHSPSKAVKEFKKLVEGLKIEKKLLAQINFAIGRELEKRDLRDQAHDLYSDASKLDSANAEIKKRLDSVSASFASGSKYDYLLRENMVTTDKLQQAFALSKKMKKSVEFVLIEHFHIKKEAIGKSFSLFYGCPFRPYDPAFTVPVELLSNLKKSFLLNELWIPLSWDKSGVEILVDDPRNLNKTDNIKTLMKTGKITFSVAIREDILEFIRHFFDQGGQVSTEASMDDAMEDFEMLPDVEFEEEEEEVVGDDVDEASSQVVKLVDQAIIAAYRKNSSDIHIEPSPITKATSIRFRLDGVCHWILPNDVCPRTAKSNFGAKGYRPLNYVLPPCRQPAVSKTW
jgi:tetratricopeptide (TPR) repeat protein